MKGFLEDFEEVSGRGRIQGYVVNIFRGGGDKFPEFIVVSTHLL